MSEGRYPILAEDDYYHLPDGTYQWTEEKELSSRADCISRTTEVLKTGARKVFVTNVFATRKQIEPYLEAARQYGYRCCVVVVENTHGNSSIHNVNSDDFEQMRRDFQVSL